MKRKTFTGQKASKAFKRQMANRSIIARELGIPLDEVGPVQRMRSSGLNRRGTASKETGFVDLAVANYPFNTTGTCTLIATVGQGASVNQRVGKKIMWKGMQIRGQISADSTTTTAAAVLIIVYDRRPVAAVPAITDVLVSADTNAFNNDANSGRFKILKRISYSLCGNNTTAGQNNDTSLHYVDEYLKLRGLPCVFKAAGTGAMGDIEQGAIYAITVGNVAAGTNDAQGILSYRTRFVDV